jgi:hypothetical protein
MIFLFKFCVHIVRFLPKAYRKEILDRKSYCVTAPVRTTVPQLLLQHIISTAFVRKKTRGLKEVAN